MTHPQMFDDDDPVLARLRTVALAFPDAAEKVSHGRPTFFTKKVFAYYGGSEKAEPGWIPHEQCVLVLPDEDDRPALLEDAGTFVPAYLGPYGWIGIDLDDGTDWDEVRELLDASFRRTAPARTVARLDP